MAKHHHSEAPQPEAEKAPEAAAPEALTQEANQEVGEVVSIFADEKAAAEREAALASKRAAAKAKIGRYRVTLNELSGVYRARDADEARAFFNDAFKTSYGPKLPGWKIERLSDEA
jgi:hypothetical protein